MSEQNVRENSSYPTAGVATNVYSFHLVLLSDVGKLYDLWLPEEPEGFFRFSEDLEHRFLSITAKNGQWSAICKRPAFFQNVPIANSYDMPLEDGQLLGIDFEDRNYCLYTERVTRERLVFHNYFVSANTVIKIGRNPNSNICYSNPYVSEDHAVLACSNGLWEIRDANSEYGTYINGERRDSAHLGIGDEIYIMGMRIIVGPNFLSVAGGAGEIKSDPQFLRTTAPMSGGYSYYPNQETVEPQEEYFNRLPRKRFEMEPQTISVEGPPVSMKNSQIPLLLRMGSSMVMGGAAALAGNFMTLISSVLFPVLSSKYTNEQRQDYENLRVIKYNEYLALKKREISAAYLAEYNYFNKRFPSPQDITTFAPTKAHLWERKPSDTDFLQVRLGLGTQPLQAKIDYPQRRFELEPDELEEEMYRVVEQKYSVDNVPITLPLAESTVCGIVGDRKNALELVQSIVLQLAYFHSYDEVKFVFLIPPEELAQMDFLRYLPHVWDDNRTIRLIATNEAEGYAVGEYIKNQLESEENQTEEKDLKDILKVHPYYVVFALNKKLLESHEIAKEVLQADRHCGVSILAVYDDIPKEAQEIITVNANGKHICTSMNTNGGEDIRFTADTCDRDAFHAATRMLANTLLRSVIQAQSLPKMVTFLEMYKAGKIEHLNPLKRWQENDPVKSLAAPVGVAADGSSFTLDLHEKRQGPHGLVAGMTGSGKSEFLISYILSMAVNYHPNEVAFVLIDYKGGGLADAFENPRTGVRLPHLAGTITNLDGASIQRSLMSIESELVRRQRVFSDVAKNFDEGSMNIYTYQKLYRAGKVSEPMPHLFIISDEFAELKQQQPEFMEKLISAARIGRSLGVHLILATQKPSGVVNDQIRSNTKFQVCLRVQDRADSMDMLKRPEAAELTDTGRFYLQVGYNEYFALGQSAWCGARYEPQDTVVVQRDDAVEFLDTVGQLVLSAKPKVMKSDSGMTQIAAVVKYLSDLAEAKGFAQRQLCLPELPKSLDLSVLQREFPCENPTSSCYGIMDDPANQEQHPFVMDILRSHNLLIAGETETGKTTFLRNVLLTMSDKLSPEEFNFYILDYSIRQFKMFKNLPHCGAVLYEEDNGMLDAFFGLINEIYAERKKLFSELEVDSFENASRFVKLPLIVVIIDNFSGLTSSKRGDSLAYQMPGYLKDCAGYGIKFFISCSRPNDVSSRIRQTIDDRLCLHMKDRYDYTDILNYKVGYIPPEAPGRGLCLHNSGALELQLGTYWANLEYNEQVAELKKTISSFCKKYEGMIGAKRLPVVDENADFVEFSGQFSKDRIPLGFAKATGKAVSLPLKQFTTLSVYIGNPQGRKPITENILYAAAREKMEVWVIRKNNSSLFEEPERLFDAALLKNADYLSSCPEDIRTLQSALVSVMTQRKEILEQNGADLENLDANSPALSILRAKTQPIMVLIESISDFVSCLDPILTFGFENLLGKTHLRNIYVVAFAEPKEHSDSGNNPILPLLGGKNVLLFGGQYEKQALCPIPGELGAIKQIPFNAGIMQYNKQIYPIVMPCGVIEQQKKDDDLESIF